MVNNSTTCTLNYMYSQQNKQSPLTSKHWRWKMTKLALSYDVENPSPGLGQNRKCGRVRPIKGIHSLTLLLYYPCLCCHLVLTCSQKFLIICLSILFDFWAYLMKVIPETCTTHYIYYLHFYYLFDRRLTPVST